MMHNDTTPAIPVILDCDPGHDDAIALLLAVQSPRIDLRAVTTVFGNCSLEDATRNALRILTLAGATTTPVARGAAGSLTGHSERGRDGTGLARTEGAIGFASLRGGTVAGDHEVIFAGPEERLILSHRAETRAIFARGAIAAARFLRGRPAGLYSMRDVIGE